MLILVAVAVAAIVPEQEVAVIIVELAKLLVLRNSFNLLVYQQVILEFTELPFIVAEHGRREEGLISWEVEEFAS